MGGYFLKFLVVGCIGLIATNGNVFGAIFLGLAYPVVIPVLKLTVFALFVNSPRG